MQFPLVGPPVRESAQAATQSITYLRFPILFAVWWCVFTFLPPTAHAQVLDIEVSNKGEVSSLRQALDKAAKVASAYTTINILFEAGTYDESETSLTWSFGSSVTLNVQPKAQRQSVVFDGKGRSNAWLYLKAAVGHRTNLRISGFTFHNYRSVIVIDGSRLNDGLWNGGLVIESNVFENIGQFNLNTKPSYAVIGLINSRNNYIRNNAFINYRNLESCESLHAIYLAHWSSGNWIEANSFEGTCGVPIKVRDRSDSNTIIRNRFSNSTGPALLVDSYCMRILQACVLERQECPSRNNTFSENFTDGMPIGQEAVLTRWPNVPPGCPSEKTRARP